MKGKVKIESGLTYKLEIENELARNLRQIGNELGNEG